MSQMNTDVDFKVRWLPYELAPGTSEEPRNKREAYMERFGYSKATVQMMAASMVETFAGVGLTYLNSDSALVSNTKKAHRVLTAAYLRGGPEAQDRAVEVLFRGYFSEGRAPSERRLLEEACEAAGLAAAEVLRDGAPEEKQLEQELAEGRGLVSGGVPHFVVQGGAGRRSFSGALSSETMKQAIESVVAR